MIVSDVVASVTISGARVDENSSPTLAAARASSAPTTIRSGLRLSSTAVPSRRNSGLETTPMSGRPITCSTMFGRAHGHGRLVDDDGAGLQRRTAISLAAAST